MKLELKHLSAYLPYNLKISRVYYDEYEKNNVSDILKLSGHFIHYNIPFDTVDYKLILQPLSEINLYDFEKENPGLMSDAIRSFMYYFHSDSQNKHTAILSAPYVLFDWCLKKHYDVFNLIKNGLAIDINTL